MSASHKKTEVIKTTGPDYLKDGLEAKARKAGCDAAEYLRDLVAMDVLGVTFGEHVANSRRSVMGFQVPAKDEMRDSK